jgi:hypothetical protein
MADLSITKPAAAQRQIDAAIRMLFLHGEDFVAIHTVAAAARTILNDLAEARGVGETDNTRFVVEFMYRNNYGLDPTDPAVEAQIKYTADAIELWGNLNLDISSEMFVYCFWWNSVNALKPENVVDTASGPVHPPRFISLHSIRN